MLRAPPLPPAPVHLPLSDRPTSFSPLCLCSLYSTFDDWIWICLFPPYLWISIPFGPSLTNFSQPVAWRWRRACVLRITAMSRWRMSSERSSNVGLVRHQSFLCACVGRAVLLTHILLTDIKGSKALMLILLQASDNKVEVTQNFISFASPVNPNLLTRCKI